MSHSTAEAGELSPRDPVEGRGHRQVAPVEGKTANTPRLGPVSTSRPRIAELARQALGMAVAIAWLPGPAGTRRRVAKPSVEEPDAAEPARPDLWGARVSNDPGLPDREGESASVVIGTPYDTVNTPRDSNRERRAIAPGFIGSTREGETRVLVAERDTRLAVVPQQVVPIQAESADGGHGSETGVRSVPIVAVEPGCEVLGALG